MPATDRVNPFIHLHVRILFRLKDGSSAPIPIVFYNYYMEKNLVWARICIVNLQVSATIYTIHTNDV